jgi:hypothetical protein
VVRQCILKRCIGEAKNAFITAYLNDRSAVIGNVMSRRYDDVVEDGWEVIFVGRLENTSILKIFEPISPKAFQ